VLGLHELWNLPSDKTGFLVAWSARGRAAGNLDSERPPPVPIRAQFAGKDEKDLRPDRPEAPNVWGSLQADQLEKGTEKITLGRDKQSSIRRGEGKYKNRKSEERKNACGLPQFLR